VVVPSGATVPGCGACCIGAQLVARAGAGGAVWAGGVAGAGGACATATPDRAISAPERNSECFSCMRENGPRARMFPMKTSQLQDLR
jgi:hypothetical protein